MRLQLYNETVQTVGFGARLVLHKVFVRMWLRTGLVALLIAAGGHAAAQESALQLTVVTGAGGAVRFGSMAPVHVLVRNSGPAVSGVLVLNWLDSLQSRPPVSEYRTLELPQNSSKRVTFYSEPGQWTTHVRVTLRDHRPGTDPRSGRALAEFVEPVSVLDAETPVLGIVGPATSGPPPAYDEEGEEWGERFYFSPDFLPDAAAGWEMCDALLYVPPPDAAPSTAELRALREYVFFGGDLVIDASAPSPVFESAGFSEFVPYVPSGQEQRDMAEYGNAVIHSVGRVERGDVILRDGDAPLVIQRAYGLGTVTAIALDLQSLDKRAASDIDDLWRELLPHLYQLVEKAGFYDVNGFDQFIDGFDSFTERLIKAVTKTPDVRIQLAVVVLLIGLYALAVGPGDFLLAKRYKRPMLTWVTFPSMVLVFTSVAFLGARVWVGGQEELHAHRAVTWFPEGALYNEAFGYFASATSTYALGAAGDPALRPLVHALDNPDVAVVDNESGERLQRIPTWTARSFTRSYIEDDEAAVTFHVALADDVYTLTVTNDGGDAIQPTALLVNGLHFVLSAQTAGVVPAGGTRDLRLPARTGSSERNVQGGQYGMWGGALTGAPRYRSWDFRTLERRGDSVLTYAPLDAVELSLAINGREVTADSVVEVHHVVMRGAGKGQHKGETQ